MRRALILIPVLLLVLVGLFFLLRPNSPTPEPSSGTSKSESTKGSQEKTFDLPVPFWLYLFGAAVVVLVSFVQIGLFVGEGHTLRRYPRFNLLRVGPLRALLTARPVLFGLRLLSVTLFGLVIFSGFLGRQDA